MIKQLSILFFIALLIFACKTGENINDSSIEENQNKSAENPRQFISLNQNWKTIREESDLLADTANIKKSNFDDSLWETVDVPHNWDQYFGYRRMKHGNLHGNAWYRKEFKLNANITDKRYFLFFEGVGSYATVWVNGKRVGNHKGGRTTFTLDITDAINFEGENTITVKAEHPSFIADLPWVCGGCSGEWGFSEGSQPLGVFRPVSLIVTNDIKIEPFGVHIWNNKTISEKSAQLYVETELKNYGNTEVSIQIENHLQDKKGNAVASVSTSVNLNTSNTENIQQQLSIISNPNLWSPENPYLYKLITKIKKEGKVIDQIETPYGIRWISYPKNRNDGDMRFHLNGKPYFINGTCEYEHNMGRSHSFTEEMISARVSQMISGGFNAFREAHQPHNLRYQKHWDQEGILFWSQFSAHIWYDTPEFKENFKQLLREWIKERRNSPSIIMWGLQNESTIPKKFAEECTAIIREMDPTSSQQRLVTTCNGGEGTDWNVIQNWSGTYGGDPYNYATELKKDLLNGEYGAWRTTDMHTEGPFDQDGKYSENRFSQLMEIKMKEAEEVRDSVVGQYSWLFSSHENPGRIQNGEAYRDIDRVGPINYKGFFTAWSEPTDTYYMYRGNYVSKETEPMVYIVSHSWPNRWNKPGKKDSIVVYSNCDEVELLNDVTGESLGKKSNPGIGEHFQWDNVNIQYNVLKAKGFVNGKEVATDVVLLNSLPESPNFTDLYSEEDILKPNQENYIYRVNAGGPEFTDSFGNTWMADVHKTENDTWGSRSWTDEFEELPAFYASQRRTWDPIQNTKNWSLFQTFRFGMDKLKFEFPIENGTYDVDLYFIEPWYGTGGGLDCTNWRNFDVAINDKIVLKNFDIWNETGHDSAIKKTVSATVNNGELIISFPNVTSGQAVISAIAIKGKNQNPAKPSVGIIQNNSSKDIKKKTWLDIGQNQYTDSEVEWIELPYQVFGAEWLSLPSKKSDQRGSFKLSETSSVYVLSDTDTLSKPQWLNDFTKIAGTAKNSVGKQFNVYLDTITKNQDFNFGKDDTSDFAIVAVPIYTMGDGEDSRPSVNFEAEDALFSGDGIKNFKDSDYIDFGNKSPASIEWEVSTGLAGIHLMRFRYMNVSDQPINVKLEIIAANGNIVRNDQITFPVRDIKWKILNTTTGDYINAGTYKIRISGESLKGLRLDSFEFQ
ncbi:malectin domain-containing carbohydrate-binding protein [Zunongwangia endophytica]|uniref:Malectin domain-containing carbohydrate-binding protein n=1 Tax=Zunongwangia endophytica TaxID=1808945 RepID=A0ABV8HBX2_9FLAO|nr:malectin domain-containing carbohydrate-binding protein [Zunongwangia endophytica]MDN3594817.1 malectin domain-containing carbohydrate-binding protein [Zunongwangia endophytica]